MPQRIYRNENINEVRNCLKTLKIISCHLRIFSSSTFANFRVIWFIAKKNQCKMGYARSGTYVCQQKVENRPKKRCPLKAPENLWFIEWSIHRVGGRQRKRGRSNYLPSIWNDYLNNLKVAQNGYMEKWYFFS